MDTDNEWIEWGGCGKPPVGPDVMVEIKCRSGEIDADLALCWWWGRDDAELSYDIIAYRVVKP